MNCAFVKVLGNEVFEVDGAKYKEIPFLKCEDWRTDTVVGDTCKTYLNESGYATTFIDSTKENVDLSVLNDEDHDFEIITSVYDYYPIKVMVLARDPLSFEILEESIQIEDAYTSIFEKSGSIDSPSDFIKNTGYFLIRNGSFNANGKLIIGIFDFKINIAGNIITFTRKSAFTHIGVLFTLNDRHLEILNSTRLNSFLKSSETNKQMLIEKDAEIQTLTDDNSLLRAENSQIESELMDKQTQLDDLQKANDADENRYLTLLIVVTILFGLALIALIVYLVI